MAMLKRQTVSFTSTKRARLCIKHVVLVVASGVCSLAVLAFLFGRFAPSHLQDPRECLKHSNADLSIHPAAQVTSTSASRQVQPQTVNIAHTGRYWWVHEYGPHWQVPGCWFRGQPLQCRFVSAAHAADNATAQMQLQEALALVHEGCWDPSTVEAQYQHLPQVMFSMEPVTNWPCLDHQPADIEMSYRSCAQVWTPYWPWLDTIFSVTQQYRDPALRRPALDFDQKLNAIIYINAQCAAKSGRQYIVRQLHAALTAGNSTLSVHSFGSCDPNMPVAEMKQFTAGDNGRARLQKKLDYFRRYKFCITMENSVTSDYVSEKVYDGLVAGCIPVYLGAPNIDSYIPDSNAIIDYAKLGDVEALKTELERLASNRDAYEQKLRWKIAAQRRWNIGFQRLLAYSEQHPMCRLCSYMADASMEGGLQPTTLCSANTSWHKRVP